MNEMEKHPRHPFPHEGENIIVNQSWRNNVGLALAVILAALGSVYCTVTYPEYAGVPLPSGRGSFPVVVFVPLGLALRWLAIMINTKLILTPEYLLLITGVVSWRKRSVRLEYNRIAEIEIVQTIPQRVLGIGDVLIMPAGTGPDAAIGMPGVANPRALKDLLLGHQDRSRSESASNYDE